jgi:phosphatidylglycerol phospholipase C
VTNGKGLIQRQPYLNALDAIQTKKLPSQPLATFDQTIALLTRPENAHVLLNLDIKLDNEPEKLFKLMRGTLERVPDYQTALAPRIVLGLWHPSFLEPAKRLLPECTRSHIGFSAELARRCFWKDCSGFSINFAVLLSPDGAAFRKECEDAGKVLWVRWCLSQERTNDLRDAGLDSERESGDAPGRAVGCRCDHYGQDGRLLGVTGGSRK